jgi:hypothetical protein
MAREREITPNVQMEELKASSARALKRGDRVIVKPTRGLAVPALFVGSVHHPLYGPMAMVMYAGRVHRVDAVRVSRPKTRG